MFESPILGVRRGPFPGFSFVAIVVHAVRINKMQARGGFVAPVRVISRRLTERTQPTKDIAGGRHE